MSDIERLRKLAGIKPKKILNESWPSLPMDPDYADFPLRPSNVKQQHKFKAGDRISGTLEFGPYRGQTLTGTIVRIIPVGEYAEINWDNGYKSNCRVDNITLAESENKNSSNNIHMWIVQDKDGSYAWCAMSDKGNARQGGFNSKEEAKVAGNKQPFKGNPKKIWAEDKDIKFPTEGRQETNESTDEYDLNISTDTFGQYKSDPIEPDFPVDMGEKFSTSSSDSGENIDQEDFSPEGNAEEDPMDDDSSEETQTDSNEESNEDHDDKVESEETDDFEEKDVKEARKYFTVKNLVKESISSTSFSEAYLEALRAFDSLSEKLIVEHNTNLSSHEEQKLAITIANEIANGKRTLKQIAESHSVRGKRDANDVIFTFTNKPSAMIFVNDLNESCDCICRLRNGRGGIQVVVREFK